MKLTLDQVPTFAKEILEELPKYAKSRTQAQILALKGDLGAGKTTFVQHLARELGVKEHVTSPTFVIVQTYKTTHPIFKKLVHIDAYRLDGDKRDTIGFKEYVSNPENLVCLEWPVYAPTPIPKEAISIEFHVADENTREVIRYGPF